MAPKAGGKKLNGTDLLHADDEVNHGLEVAPAVSVSTSKSIQLKLQSKDNLRRGFVQHLDIPSLGIRPEAWTPWTHGTLKGMFTPGTPKRSALGQSEYSVKLMYVRVHRYAAPRP